MDAFNIRYRAIVATLCVAAALGRVGTAAAQSASAQAEAMFREGRALLAAGKVEEACAAFESSQTLDPAASTLMNLAACRERNHQIVTAWGLFLDAARVTRDAKDSATTRLHHVALERAKRIEPRMSTLTIKVSAESRVDGLAILRDTDNVEPAMWNRTLPIDGGSYRITARAPGATPRIIAITIGAEADTRTVEIPRLEKSTASVVVDAQNPAVPKATSHDVGGYGSDHAHARSKVLPLAITGGAVLLLGGALGFGLWGNSTYHAASNEQMDQARRDSLYDDANTRRHVALGTGIAGLACGGVAAWLYSTGRTAQSGTTATNSAQAHVVPVVGVSGGSTGLAIVGDF